MEGFSSASTHVLPIENSGRLWLSFQFTEEVPSREDETIEEAYKWLEHDSDDEGVTGPEEDGIIDVGCKHYQSVYEDPDNSTRQVVDLTRTPDKRRLPSPTDNVHHEGKKKTKTASLSAKAPQAVNKKKAAIESDEITNPTLFITNLTPSVDNIALYDWFSMYGALDPIRRTSDRKTGALSNSAYVDFKTLEDAHMALAMYRPGVIANADLRVEFAGPEAQQGAKEMRYDKKGMQGNRRAVGGKRGRGGKRGK